MRSAGTAKPRISLSSRSAPPLLDPEPEAWREAGAWFGEAGAWGGHEVGTSGESPHASWIHEARVSVWTQMGG